MSKFEICHITAITSKRPSLVAKTVGRTPKTTSDDSRSYDRLRDLPGLIPLWPEELRTPDLTARLRLVVLLRKALREERQRGLAGHWTYNLTRHIGLLNAYRAEREALKCIAGNTADVAISPQHHASPL